MSSPRASNALLAVAAAAALALALTATAQTGSQAGHPDRPSPALRARRFLAGRTTSDGTSAAAALRAARAQHLALAQAQSASLATARAAQPTPRSDPASLSAPWTSLGPMQVASQRYGLVTGRVTSIAIDPSDPSGNTVYLGTTGGGVWRSTNAAGPAASVTFTPLTDTLPVFNANADSVAIPSLSIGAVSVSPGSPAIVLAGTGDPNDASDSYYGEGILRSTDGGATWTLAQQSSDSNNKPSFVGLGVAGFAWSTVTPSLAVVAISQSAEGRVVNAPNTIASTMGLYYSTDSGATWHMATVEDGSQPVQNLEFGVGSGNAATAVVWNPIRQRFYAAIRYHGYYESADGITWTRLASQPGTGLTLAACPTLGASPNCPIFRGALAVEPTTGDTFALTVDANNLDQGLWRDVCALSSGSCSNPVAFGSQLPSAPLEAGNGSTAIPQGDYNLALAAVHSGSDTLLFAGTADLYRCSLAAGCTLRNTTNATNGCAAPAKVAPAQHAIAALADAGAAGAPLLYLGNDSGLWRSLDGVNQQQPPCSSDDAAHFDNLNSGLGSLAEVVSLAADPTSGTTLLAGLAANGTAATSAAGSQSAWPQLASGEGGPVAIDQANPQNWYVSNGAGVNVTWCSGGSACSAPDFTGPATLGAAQLGGDSSLVAPPLLLDPAAPGEMLVGTCRAWRGPAQSAAGWSAISTQMGTPNDLACTASSAMLRSLAAGGPAQGTGSAVLYAGMAGSGDGGSAHAGHVFALNPSGSAAAATAWTDVSTTNVTNDVADAGRFNPGGFDISSLTADPHDASGMTVYATVMGFSGMNVNAPHIYRSTDGGAHWTNISSNLPNAPANALAIDPNDANTVYVAMDTGVYVTNAVTTCASANCWSVYGTGLPNAPVIALSASAGIELNGLAGVLRAGTYGRGIWQTSLLSALNTTNPAIALAPASLSFAAQSVSTLSAAQSVTVTNSGAGTLTVSRVATTGDFVETDDCTSNPGLAPGASCTLEVSFLPSATGARTGVLTVYGNVPGGQAALALTGTGTPAGAVTFSPSTVTFPGTDTGSTSSAQTVTLSNSGGDKVNLQPPSATGDFAIVASTCSSSLGPALSCTIAVVFKPSASGARTGSLTITDDAGTQTAWLSGSGVAAATDSLSPASLTFAAQSLNTPSASQQVTLTNSGDAALTLIAAQATGDFAVVNNCGNSLNGHASCAMLVTFTPKSIGPGSGTLTVSDALRSQTVALSGTGIAPAGVSLSPANSVSFPATGVGLTAAAQTVTLTNNGAVPLSVQNIAITGDFAIVSGSNGCGAALAPGSACTLQVSFTPTAAGARTGALTVADSAPGSPQTLALSGTGIDFTLTPSGSTSATVAAGAPAVYTLLVGSDPGLTGTVALTCGQVPANATCVLSPSGAPLGGTTLITVTVATAVSGALLHPSTEPLERTPEVWFAAALPLGFAAGRRRRTALLLALLVALAGCASSRVLPNSGSSGNTGGGPGSSTGSGTYNLTITGTSSGLTRTAAFTLIVQ